MPIAHVLRGEAAYCLPVVYDPLLESVRLIDSGLPTMPPRLSRRRRFIPLAVDVDDDAAVTVFLRRGAGADCLDGHLLTRESGTWRVESSGSAGQTLDELVRRRSVTELGGFGRVEGGGGVLVAANPERWVIYAWLELVPDVMTVVAGRRAIAVPWHHHAAVLQRSRQAQRVSLIGAYGETLERLSLNVHGPIAEDRRREDLGQ